MTTYLGSVLVAQGSWGCTVNRNVLRELTAMDAAKFVTA